MKTPSLLTFLWLAASTLGLSAAEMPAVKPVSPYAVLESLVGGVWVATLPAQKDHPPVSIELAFAWTENRQGVRFHSEFVQGGKRAPYASGLYVWNAAKQRLLIIYTDSSASLTEGVITQEGNVLVNALTVTASDGTVENLQVRLTKVGGNVFTNEIFRWKNGGWEKFIAVRYERHEYDG